MLLSSLAVIPSITSSRVGRQAKMRSPREVSLGPDGLQRLFSVSGILSADAVRENLI